MVFIRRHLGFSMIEVLAVIAIITVLAVLVLGLGKRIKVQANEDLCKSEINIIVAAMDQYYNQYGAFPFTTDPSPYAAPPFVVDAIFEQLDLKVLLDNDFGVLPVTSGITGAVEDGYASSEALYYYFDKKCPNSRKLIDKLATMLISSGDSSGQPREYLINGTRVLDLVRFVDPWGNSLRYLYSAGDVYPVIESAGADGYFNTLEDNITSD